MPTFRARHHEDVIGTGALEVCQRVAVDELVFSYQNGIDQRGICRRP